MIVFSELIHDVEKKHFVTISLLEIAVFPDIVTKSKPNRSAEVCNIYQACMPEIRR